MPLSRATRRLTTWIATLAVLVAALAPAVQALAGQDGASWIQLCTTQGPKWVPADGSDNEPASTHAGPLFEHCPYCAYQAQAVGIPPDSQSALDVPRLRYATPRAFLAGPPTLHAWASAHPRAPPRFS